MRLRTLVWIGAVMGASLGPAALAQGRAPATVKSCETCHGPGGDSTVASTPRLNGQHADYILSRLKDFRDVTRETPHATYSMWQVVSNLSNSARAAVADYFAGQPATPAKPGEQARLGERIYRDGVSSQGIPACQSCHGPKGEGEKAVPRLAGQHADYLRTQMWVFSFLLRVNDVMHPSTKNMTGEQIDAVTSYLAND